MGLSISDSILGPLFTYTYVTFPVEYVCACVYIYMPWLHEVPVEIPGVGGKTYANEDAALLCISPLS